MLQPFEPLKMMYVQKLIQLKKTYLVSQTYDRAVDHFSDTAKTAILFSDYADEGPAQIHLNAVKHDKYAAIMNLKKQEHYNKLMQLMAAESKYDLYWAVVRSTADLEKRINMNYKEKMRAYIKYNTNWVIGGDETIKPAISVIFGELFITLKYGGQTLKIKFSDIERAYDFREDFNKKTIEELSRLLSDKEEQWFETNQDVIDNNARLKEEILYIKNLLEFRNQNSSN